jgi:Mg2+ and Co2+ transporter CorA
MAGDDEYELLSHDEIERLRREAHQGEGDYTEAINSIQRTQESVEDLRRLLSSVKEHVLEDYAKSPNPESLLEEVRSENQQIAKSLVQVVEQVQTIEDKQDQLSKQIEEVAEKVAHPDSQTATQGPPASQFSMDQNTPEQPPEQSAPQGDPGLQDLDDVDFDDEDDSGGLLSGILGS